MPRMKPLEKEPEHGPIQCPDCAAEGVGPLPSSEFYRNRGNYTRRCKRHHKAYTAARAKEAPNPEAQRRAWRAWAERNQEKRRAQWRDYWQRNGERIRERSREARRVRREEHAEGYVQALEEFQPGEVGLVETRSNRYRPLARAQLRAAAARLGMRVTFPSWGQRRAGVLFVVHKPAAPPAQDGIGGGASEE